MSKNPAEKSVALDVLARDHQLHGELETLRDQLKQHQRAYASELVEAELGDSGAKARAAAMLPAEAALRERFALVQRTRDALKPKVAAASEQQALDARQQAYDRSRDEFEKARVEVGRIIVSLHEIAPAISEVRKRLDSAFAAVAPHLDGDGRTNCTPAVLKSLAESLIAALGDQGLLARFEEQRGRILSRDPAHYQQPSAEAA